MASETKERILDRSAELFRRQGYTGTGVKQIVAEASAPFGSLYHFFPGGKEQLGAEAIRSLGRCSTACCSRVLRARRRAGVHGIRDFFAGAAETLRETDYADACPIATVALEVVEHQRAAAPGVRRRLRGLDRRRRPSASSKAGIPRERARDARDPDARRARGRLRALPRAAQHRADRGRRRGRRGGGPRGDRPARRVTAGAPAKAGRPSRLTSVTARGAVASASPPPAPEARRSDRSRAAACAPPAGSTPHSAPASASSSRRLRAVCQRRPSQRLQTYANTSVRVGVVEAERAAGAEVPVGARPGPERAVGLGELEAEAEAGVAVEHEVLAVGPRPRRLREQVGAEQLRDAREHLRRRRARSRGRSRSGFPPRATRRC